MSKVLKICNRKPPISDQEQGGLKMTRIENAMT